ncbi:MAG: hypothetical protein Q7S40_01325 [Opitutaceae bacterium]|nr:hypothetical protein [Opitutaceae bacterium]
MSRRTNERSTPARRRLPPVARFALLAATLGVAGCATQGPLHVYTLGAGGERPIQDQGNDGSQAESPSFIEPEDVVTGFAYDPFTDHFFLRLAPGNVIRVVDRPARAIKREFTISGAPEDGGGDLAVRPRDGHLFLLHPSEPVVLEASRLGKMIGTIPLAAPAGRPIGIAYDPPRDQLLLLAADGRQVTRQNTAGERMGGLTLDREAGSALAFDSERRELYAPLRAAPGGIGVFDENGRLQRTVSAKETFVDVGPRSFIRVF